MLEKFIKYQSLGNDFVILDCYKKPLFYVKKLLESSKLKTFIKNQNKQKFGIGFDGVLIISQNQSFNLPESFIFNADGSKAEICLNGIRCVADYLFKTYNFEKELKIKMGEKIITCQQEKNTKNIITKIELPAEINFQKIKMASRTFSGYSIHAPNPHFIIFEEISKEELLNFGPQIENHSSFPNKTNVEFVWQKTDAEYQLLVFERGVGITLACSSGASALFLLLLTQDKIKINQKIKILMPGGNLTCWSNQENQICLQATANYVFRGEI